MVSGAFSKFVDNYVAAAIAILMNYGGGRLKLEHFCQDLRPFLRLNYATKKSRKNILTL